MSRALGARRLSHGTDASTSIERQGESITAWCDQRNHTRVHMTDDTDVSGSISPFDRPDLGKWLKPQFLDRWDILVVTKIDRLSRSLLDFVTTLDWLEARGKTLVVIESDLDFSTPMGRFVAKILALFAEFEREMMSSRRADSSAKIASRAGWHGGNSTSWGYREVKRAGVWELEPDPGMVPTVQEIVQAILAGESGQSVAQRHEMDPTRLLRRLRSPSLHGAVVFHGEVVRGNDGMPLLREPIIDRRTWDRLQAQLDRNSRKATPRDGTPWLDVVYCSECGHEMYRQSYSSRNVVRYYHRRILKKYRTGEAQWCPANINGRSVEDQIDGLVRRAWRGRNTVESVEIPGEDHTAELRGVEEAITDWEAKALLAGASAESILRILDGLHARKRAIIEAGVVIEARTETVESDVPLMDLWESCPDDHARGALLRRLGYRLYIRKAGYGAARVRLERTWRGRTWRELIPEMDDFDAKGWDTSGAVIDDPASS
jgi:DNA invertase Pin-like site-specific DNA recombinase